MTDYDTCDVLQIREGAVRIFSVDFRSNDFIPDDLTIASVESVDVDMDSGVETSGFITDGDSILAGFDAAVAVARDDPYEVCIAFTLSDGNSDIAIVPLLVQEGCKTTGT